MEDGYVAVASQMYDYDRTECCPFFRNTTSVLINGVDQDLAKKRRSRMNDVC